MNNWNVLHLNFNLCTCTKWLIIVFLSILCETYHSDVNSSHLGLSIIQGQVGPIRRHLNMLREKRKCAAIAVKALTSVSAQSASCKWRCLWLLPGRRAVRRGITEREEITELRRWRAKRYERGLSAKPVTQADGAAWEISFGRGLHGLDPICPAPSGPLTLPPTRRPPALHQGRAQHVRGGSSAVLWLAEVNWNAFCLS